MSVSINVLLVAGGGGGGAGRAGGGGGGGVVATTQSLSFGGDLSVTVGLGGAGSTDWTSSAGGARGGNSVFNGLTAVGGGGGMNEGGGSSTSGGSGGGGTAPGNSGGSGTVGQGNSGGTGGDATNYCAGGGGGAGGAGANGTSISCGNGGAGVSSSISGTSVNYGGGGGGGGNGGVPGTGTDGGGNGQVLAGTAGTAGTDGLGGGGGGGSGTVSRGNGGNGGKGIVIISYATGTLTATGGTVTTNGGNTIHTFTSSGIFSVTSPPPAPKASLGKFIGSGTSVTSVKFDFDNSDSSDSSGNGNDGSASNVSFAGGLNGAHSASFNGTSSSLRVFDGTGIQVTSSLTMGATVVFYSLPSIGSAAYVFIRGNETGQWTGVVQTTDSGGPSRFFSAIAHVGVSDIGIVGSEPIAVGKRYVVRWVYDAVNSQFRFYVNGIRIGTSGTSGSLRSDANGIMIGMGFSGNYHLDGKIDEFMYEQTAWDDAKAHKDYTHSIGRFSIV